MTDQHHQAAPTAESADPNHRDPADVVTPEWIAELATELDKCDDAHQAIVHAIGSATMCWEHVERAGVFRSVRALAIGETLHEHLQRREAPVVDERGFVDLDATYATGTPASDRLVAESERPREGR